MKESERDDELNKFMQIILERAKRKASVRYDNLMREFSSVLPNVCLKKNRHDHRTLVYRAQELLKEYKAEIIDFYYEEEKQKIIGGK